MSNYPRAFSHIGITVPNLEEAVKFYSDVMGWYIMMGPTEVLEEIVLQLVKCALMYLVMDGEVLK